MRPWPRASAAAAAFIFKLLSGQRARRGRGPRPAASLILGRPAATRPPSGSLLCGSRLTCGCARAGLHTRATLHGCGVTGGFGGGGLSAAAAATAGGQDRGPAAHPARPALRATTQRRLRSEWERSRPVASKAQSRRLPGVGPPRPRFCCFAPRRPSPRRGPTLLYRPGWAWPLRMYQVRGGRPPPQLWSTEPPRAAPEGSDSALRCSTENLRTLLLWSPQGRRRAGGTLPATLPPPAAARWYVPRA